ncbi:lasso peptide biosynthesis B2 protein [Desulfomarina sp.]
MASFRRFFSLTFSEKLVFCQAFLLVFRFRRALKHRSFDDLLRESSAQAEKRLARFAASSLSAGRISWLIKKSAMTVVKSRCLPQALAGHIIFAEYGYRTCFHIGVRKGDGRLEAHAWLTLNDKVILGDIPDLEQFEELPVSSYSIFE